MLDSTLIRFLPLEAAISWIRDALSGNHLINPKAGRGVVVLLGVSTEFYANELYPHCPFQKVGRNDAASFH